MAERKEETHAQWLLTFCQHQTGGVIDRCDVIGIECVTQTETVSQSTGARVNECAFTICDRVILRIGVEVDEKTPAHDMQHRDKAQDSKERRPFAPLELQRVAKARLSWTGYAGHG